jgi:hypothetical protein
LLSKSKLRRFAQYADTDVREYFRWLLGQAEMVTNVPDIRVVAADPKDDPIIATAVAAEADYLVTVDHAHLLPIGEYEGIKIISPQAFLKMLAWAKSGGDRRDDAGRFGDDRRQSAARLGYRRPKTSTPKGYKRGYIQGIGRANGDALLDDTGSDGLRGLRAQMKMRLDERLGARLPGARRADGSRRPGCCSRRSARCWQSAAC